MLNGCFICLLPLPRVSSAELNYKPVLNTKHVFAGCLYNFFCNSASSLALFVFAPQADVGLIPRICEGLFTRITGMTRRDEASFRTEVRWVKRGLEINV